MLTFDHVPSAPRNVPRPDSADTPAPVSTTMRKPPSRRSAASFVVSFAVVSGTVVSGTVVSWLT